MSSGLIDKIVTDPNFDGLPQTKMMRVSDIQKHGLRHHSLPPELLSAIAEVHKYAAVYVGGSLEQWEIDFMRDEKPEEEVELWQRIIDCHKRYLAQYKTHDAKNVFRYLLGVSMGSVPKKPDWLYKSVKRFAGASIVKPFVLTRE